MSSPSANPGARRRVFNAAQAAGALILWFFGVVASPALAVLGGDVSSVSADRVALQGQRSDQPMLQYDLHVITAATGTVVNEYTSRDNRVFAITWHGPTPPDLRALFGAYFDGFQSAAAASVATRAGAHRQLSLVQADFVFRAAGHARAFRGRAYVPSLVPSGVAADDLP